MPNSPVIRSRYLILVDIGIAFLSFVLAGLIRFETTVGVAVHFARHNSLLWLSLLIRIPIYLALGLYDRLWRYASMPDAVRIVIASLSSTVLVYVVNFFALPAAGLPCSNSHSIFLLDSLLNLLFVGGHRFWWRVYSDWRRRGREGPRIKEVAEHRVRTLIVGADDAGEVVVRYIKHNPELGIEVVGFVDDNPAMHRMRIHNVPVLGRFSHIPQLIHRDEVDQVIITNSNSHDGHVKEIKHWCRSCGIPVETVPAYHELFAGVVNQHHIVTRQPDASQRPALVYHNLLVTGGAGFIGADFVRYMLETHPAYRLVVYDKLTYAGNLYNLRGLAKEYGDRYAFVRGDICNPDTVARTMQEYQIDGIVNFAAETHVDRSLMMPGDFAHTNIHGTCVLLEQARKFGVQRYHQISTDEVYGQILDGSFKETDPIVCRSPYSASKASGDVMCLAYFTSFGLPVTISRGSNSIGPYQHVEKAVPLFTTNALDDLPLPVYGDGLYERDYQYVRDHCEGTDMILHRGTPGQVYNLGSGREMAAIDLAVKICDLLGKPHSLIHFVEDRPGQDRRYSLDCTKVIALGWRPKHTTEQALEKTVRWYVENEWWWRVVKEGEYQEYYRRQYEERLKHSTRAVLTPARALPGTA